MRSEPPEPICNGSSMFLYQDTVVRPEFPYGDWTPIQQIKVKVVPREEALANLAKVNDLDRKSMAQKVVEPVKKPEDVSAPPSPTMTFRTQPKQQSEETDIATIAQNFKSPGSRKGPKFDEFRAKLGLEKDQIITNIVDDRIQVDKKGKKKWENIQELYDKQSSPKEKPKF